MIYNKTIVLNNLVTEALPSKGDGGISDLLKIDSSSSPSLALLLSSSIFTTDGCVCVIGSKFLLKEKTND